MQLVNNQTGSVEDVADEQVEGAFKGGSHSFLHPEQRVPIRTPDGEIGSVAAKDAQTALENGATIASQEEFHKADLDARYGDVGHSLAAAGEGVARGLTVGALDPLAIGTARMFGGDAAADATREHLKGAKEAHPWLSTGGEIAGAILPTLLTDGAAAPEEAAAIGGKEILSAAGERAVTVGADAATAAAEGAGAAKAAAKAPGFVSQALQWTPAGMTSRLGLAAEHGAAEVLGAKTGTSAIGRIVGAGIRAAASGAAEGPIYGAGNYLSESSLGNEDLNGEKFVAAVGHGFLYGALTGAAGGTALAGMGEVGQSLLRRAKPYLEREAGLQAAKSVGLTAKQSKEILLRTEGPADVGNTWIKEGVVPNDPISAAKMSLEDYKARFEEAVERKGKEIGDALRIHGASADVPVKAVDDALTEIIKPIEGVAGWRNVEQELKSYRADLFDKLGVETDEATAIARAEGVANKTSYIRNSPMWRDVYEKELATLSRKEVPFADLMRQRKGLDDLIYRETSPLVGNAKLEELRKLRGKFGDLEVASIDRAARKVGLENGGAALKRLRTDYQHLRIGEDAITGKFAREVKNNSASLTEHMAGTGGGVAGAVVGLATGHAAAGAVVGHLALKYLRKAAREHGNVMAASALSRIANLDLIARASRSVDNELDAAIGSLTGRTKPRLRVRRFSGPDDKSPPEKKYEDAHKSISPYRDVTEEHVENALPGLTQHAPLTSNSVVRAINTGAVYLKSKMPTPLNQPSIVDPNPKPRTDDVTAEEFHSVRRAVEDPVGVLRDGIEDGKITRAQVEAIQATKPALIEDVQRKLLEELAKPRKEPLPYDRLTSLSLIFGVAADPTLDPAHVQNYQATYSQPGAGGPGGGAAKPSSSPAKLSGLKSFSQGSTLGLERAGQH